MLEFKCHNSIHPEAVIAYNHKEAPADISYPFVDHRVQRKKKKTLVEYYERLQGDRLIGTLLQHSLQEIWSLVTQVAEHLPILVPTGSVVIQGPEPAVSPYLLLWLATSDPPRAAVNYSSHTEPSSPIRTCFDLICELKV